MISSDPAATSALLEFLRSVDGEATGAGLVHESPIRSIFFTDQEGHPEMMQRLGDMKGRDVLGEHERITRNALAAHGGGEIKTMGDGFMASLNSTQLRSSVQLLCNEPSPIAPVAAVRPNWHQSR